MSGNIRLFCLGANGFPIGTYRPVLDRLSQYVEENAHKKCDIITHDYFSNFPSDDVSTQTTWQPCIDSIITSIDQANKAGGGDKVVGIGHSAGGAMLCCVASQRPDFFSKVIVVDPPMFSATKRFGFTLGKLLPQTIQLRFNPLIKGALRKKNKFQSMQEAGEYFRSRKIFRTFSDEIVDAFLDSNIYQPAPGVEFTQRFSNIAEANIYRSVPTEVFPSSNNVGQYGAFGSAVTFLHSSAHQFLSQSDVNYLRRRFASTPWVFREYQGGHFFPFEDPDGYAKLLLHNIPEH